MKMNKNLTINSGFLLSLVFLAAIVFLSHSFFDHYTKQDKEENSVFSLIVTLDELIKSLRDERTAQRDYINTDDKRYLEAYRSAVQSVDRELGTLQVMTHHSSRYQDKLAGIMILIQKRQKALDEGIENGLRNTNARGMISEILERVSDMKKQAIRDLQESSASQQQNLKIIWYMLVINGILVVILFSTIFLLLRRDIAHRMKEDLELRRHRDQLDELVTHRTEELLTANQLLQAEMHVRKQADASLHKLTQHMEIVREEERVAISRDIHDEIGQSLTALKLDLAWMEHKFLPGNSEFIGRLNMMRSSLDRLIGKAQNIIAGLRPPLLDSLGFVEAIDWQVREFKRRNGIACQLNLDKTINGLDEKASTALIRIAMEALTNISRHAQATMVNVSLVKREETLVLEISDNGRGMSSEAINTPTSYGLLGMRERAHLCHGALAIKETPGGGTTVSLTIPMESVQEQS